jgi:hypothetical protein
LAHHAGSGLEATVVEAAMTQAGGGRALFSPTRERVGGFAAPLTMKARRKFSRLAALQSERRH